ncbi:ligand-binding sensor domain-containing protein [Flaviaesturariibacter amylovorans]|uniref:Two component regulator three Y domain-containing protein n=1 Tax=Flaviaesturariibacter amylovorans TaxID=1084520 RepID=A0ABP8GIY3_9BACT
MRRPFLLLLLLLLCGIAGLRAQRTRQYSFQHFTTAQGLGSNFITSIVQDADRFIWVATKNGLQRYDGNVFLKAQIHPESSRDGLIDKVEALWRDARGRIWILGTNNRVALLDTRRFRYREARVLPARTHSTFANKYLFEGDGGQLLLHEAFGPLYRFDSASFSFRSVDNMPFLKSGRGTTMMAWDPWERKYWMASDTGLTTYHPRTGHYNLYGNNPGKDPHIEAAGGQVRVYQVYVTEQYLYYWYWLLNVGNPVVVRMDKRTGQKSSHVLSSEMPLGYHEVTGFLRQRSGRMWVYGSPFLGEWTDGARPFQQVSSHNVQNEQGLRFDRMYTAYEDAERNLWLGTDNGLYLFNPDAQLFNTYSLVRPGGDPVEAPVMVLCQLTDSSFFVGTWSKGIFYFDKDFNPLPLPPDLAALKLPSYWDMGINRRTREVWMGLQPGGLIVYNQTSKAARHYKPAILRGVTVRQVVSDYEGNMWIGLHDGRVLKWDIHLSGGDPAKGYIPIMRTGPVNKIHLDRHGYLWVAGEKRGLYKIHPVSGRVVQEWHAEGPEGFRLFSNEVTDMTQFNDTTLLATAGAVNIVNLRTGAVTFFSSADGLPSDNAMSLQRDFQDIVWIGLNNGLCRLNLKKRTAVFYDRRDGMIHDNFITAGVERLSSGRIIFYTAHNMLMFDPKRFSQTTPPPPPVITGMTLQGEPLPLDSLAQEGSLMLRYDRNALTFEFSGLTYIRQKKFHYFYKLEGLDKEWLHLENDNRAIYNYLPPGHYTFQVKSEDADGLTSTAAFSIPIRVRPPVWQTWWFYGLMILIGAFGLYIIDRERLRRLRSLQQVRTQIAGNLHQEVETTLSDIHVLSEIAKIRAGTNVEQSKAFIDQISRKSHNMMEAMDDVLWSIDPKNDSMERTLMRIREFTDGIKSNHTMDIDLIVDRKIEQLELSMVLRHELFFFYKETLQFLLQHVICDQVFINLKLKRSTLLVEIITACEEEVPDFRNRFHAAIGKRVQSMGGLLEITPDRSSLSVVLRVPL